MNKSILLLFVAALLTSCGSLTNYWHEEEDDVYFVSETKEEVELVIIENDSNANNSYGQSNTQTPSVVLPGTNRRTTRRNRRSTDPAYCPPGGTRTTTPRIPRTSTPRTSTPRTSPAPSTPRPRPSAPKSSTPR